MGRVLVQKCNDDFCMYVGKTAAQFVDSLIAPDGTFYEVGACGHDHAAVEHGMISLDKLEAEGWVHLSLEYRGLIVNRSLDRYFKVSTAQLNKLFDVLDDLDAQIAANEEDTEYMHDTYNFELKDQRSILHAFINNPDSVKEID